MRTSICIATLMCLGACGNDTNRPITFTCTSSGEETANPGQTVLFHTAEGYLFLQNDQGAAENVCSKRGTVDCSVSVTRKAITVHQTVEEQYCGYRDVAKTVLDIDRASGTFRLLQEGCDPQGDIVITGTCQSSSK